MKYFISKNHSISIIVEVIIVSPSLNPSQNVSGISAVTKFIIDNNPKVNYIHFELGRKDNERGRIYRLKAILINIREWIKLLNKYPNAYIHYNFPLSKASILRDPLFMLIAKLKKRKIIIHLHGGVFLSATHIPYFFNLILKKIFSWIIPFIVLSQKEAELIKKRFGCQNIHILPNCIDLKEAYNYNKIINEGNPLTIGYLGRIASTKGMDYLFEACKILTANNTPFILKLAGKEEIDGEYINKFKEELKENFIYEGVISGDKKRKYLKSLDLFVLPSFFEGLPMALLECMSYGVVPVTTNVGSIGEIVINNYNGIFIEVKNSQSIYEKINMLHYNRNIVKILSKNAQNTIFKNFSVTEYIERLNKIYKSVQQMY